MTTKDVLAAWKAKALREVTLPSGTTVTIQLTTIRDEMLAGRFSGPVLAMARAMESQTFEAGKELSDEDLSAFSTLQASLVAASVKAIEGVEVELSAEDVKELPRDDQDALWAYAMRLRPLPKATP